MIEEILPSSAVAIEARHDPADVILFPRERATVDQAVEKRRLEYTTARACARAALKELGIAPAPILTGEHGEPLWPVGVVGSITHCHGYRACAVGRAADLPTIGIDAEPHDALPDGLIGDIARPEELVWLRRLQLSFPEVCWDRLLFSAKESVYKAWFPLAKSWLGFEDATLTVDPRAEVFAARLLVSAPVLGDGCVTGFRGRWLVRDGLILTAIAAVDTGGAYGMLAPTP